MSRLRTSAVVGAAARGSLNGGLAVVERFAGVRLYQARRTAGEAIEDSVPGPRVLGDVPHTAEQVSGLTQTDPAESTSRLFESTPGTDPGRLRHRVQQDRP